jgi:hypothetical protein
VRALRQDRKKANPVAKAEGTAGTAAARAEVAEVENLGLAEVAKLLAPEVASPEAEILLFPCALDDSNQSLRIIQCVLLLLLKTIDGDAWIINYVNTIVQSILGLTNRTRNLVLSFNYGTYVHNLSSPTVSVVSFAVLSTTPNHKQCTAL